MGCELRKAVAASIDCLASKLSDDKRLLCIFVLESDALTKCLKLLERQQRILHIRGATVRDPHSHTVQWHFPSNEHVVSRKAGISDVGGWVWVGQSYWSFEKARLDKCNVNILCMLLVNRNKPSRKKLELGLSTEKLCLLTWKHGLAC